MPRIHDRPSMAFCAYSEKVMQVAQGSSAACNVYIPACAEAPWSGAAFGVSKHGSCSHYSADRTANETARSDCRHVIRSVAS